MSTESAPIGRVLVDDEALVRVVTISNPTKKNALSRAMLDALARALVLDESSPIRAIVLTGDRAGGAFSAGFDVTSIDDDERARGLDPIAPVTEALRRSTRPIVAAIDGPCMGGALEIALACTVRVSSSGARFLMPPARLGLVYARSGLETFLSRLAPGQVARLFLAAEPLDAAEASRIGLVDVRVDEPRAAIDEARRLAARMAEGAPLAVRGMTTAIHRHRSGAGFADDDARLVDELRARSLASNDLQEGVRAFREKRPPTFRGE